MNGDDGKFMDGTDVEEIAKASNIAHFRKRNGADNDEPPRNMLRFRHVSELQVRAPDWLVRGILEADALGVIFGDSGTGKSFLSLDLACCIATGIPWHGHDVVTPGPVLYLAGEGQAGIARRLRAWQLHHGVTLDDAVPLYVSVVATALTDKKAQAMLRHEVDKFTASHGAPRLIVLDTLNRHFGDGDENSTQDMTTALRSCDVLRQMTGATVLTPHHSGHGDKTRARGSSVLHTGIDVEYMLAANGENTIAFTAIKTKDGATPEPLAFRLQPVTLDVIDSDGEAVTSAVMVSTAYQGPLRKTTAGNGALQKRALAILCEMMDHNRTNVVASGRAAECARVELTQWKEACRHAGIDRRRLPELEKSLVDAGLILIEGVHVTPVSEASETCPNPDDSDGRVYQ